MDVEKHQSKIGEFIKRGDELKVQILNSPSWEKIASDYQKWNLACIQILTDVYGKGADYTEEFINDKVKGEIIIKNLTIFGSTGKITKAILPFRTRHRDVKELCHVISHQIGTLDAAKNAVSNEYLTNIRSGLSVEVLESILDKAEALLKEGLKDPVAILAYSVLECSFRRMCDAKGIDYSEKESISSLILNLKDEGVFKDEDLKRIQVFVDIGNAAVHAKFYVYTSKDIKEMLEWTRNFVKSKPHSDDFIESLN
jgi:HEPN domain-containing protein